MTVAVDRAASSPASTLPSRWRRVPLAVGVPLLVVVLAGSVVAAVMIGPVPIPASTVLQSIASHLGLGTSTAEPRLDGIAWDLRLPRVLTAAVCGMGLAGVGAVMQGVTRNPLADPYLLGLSSGASLGAVAVVALGIGAVGSPTLAIGAFIGATVAFAVVLAIASTGGRLPPVRTILAGVAIGELCAAATAFVTVSATDAQATRSLLVWLLGGFAGADWAGFVLSAVILALFAVVICWYTRTLDALALGDDTAQTLGIDVHRSRRRLLI
ncbi:MAG: iron chelate uptake ABC transporter family permease subunit, partial [Acidimicrobiales bacterium]|nr:iron chelate uptake ABC transporter family permease subunit [Acidimicrobiales bacterium]